MVGYGIAAYALIFISPQQKPFNFELSLAVSDLLDKADKEAIFMSVWQFQVVRVELLSQYGRFSFSSVCYHLGCYPLQ